MYNWSNIRMFELFVTSVQFYYVVIVINTFYINIFLSLLITSYIHTNDVSMRAVVVSDMHVYRRYWMFNGEFTLSMDVDSFL